MTFGNILLVISVVMFLSGTIGLVKDIREKHRQRQSEKHYAAMRQAETDNE